MKISGIYTITNLVTNQIYVGFTNNMSERWQNHRLELSGNRHKSYYLQNDYNKYGKENFLFEIIEECEERFLCSAEHYWCNMLHTHNREYGYNIARTNPNGIIMKPMLRKNHSDETKAQISKNRKGKCLGTDNGFFGKKHSEETKKVMSEKGKGRIPSDEFREKMSKRLKGKMPKNIEILKNYMRGKHLTEEQKIHISNIQKMKIFQFTRDGTFIKEFPSAIDAAQECGFKCPTELTRCARAIDGKQRTYRSNGNPRNVYSAYGYIWKYNL